MTPEQRAYWTATNDAMIDARARALQGPVLKVAADALANYGEAVKANQVPYPNSTPDNPYGLYKNKHATNPLPSDVGYPTGRLESNGTVWFYEMRSSNGVLYWTTQKP